MTPLRDLVPESVTVRETAADLAEPLLPQEEPFVARAVGKRRREFTTVRACARSALAHLGVAPVPILPGERGAPGWPPGIVGSMTHCDGYRAAAVARRRDIRSIGIDAEPNAPLPAGVLESVGRPAEREMVRRLATDAPATHWDRLLFSAKESVYKAWFPLTGAWLGFEDAEILIDPAGRTFTARLLVPWPVDTPPLHRLDGRWASRDGLVISAIVVPA
ncbi:4'-phosphopantetheinyl transferase superfamily protein [Dactylosporangium sp. NPDC051485]|uniref:4'-phosphopantetheinyl transferase family protein n=1 Tax=Dactylosporangium sp. NPDC051485 TaxID=3154846 RepID=UPI00343AB77C